MIRAIFALLPLAHSQPKTDDGYVMPEEVLTTQKLSFVDNQALTKTRQQKFLTQSCYNHDKFIVVAPLIHCQ